MADFTCECNHTFDYPNDYDTIGHIVECDNCHLKYEIEFKYEIEYDDYEDDGEWWLVKLN